MAVENPPSAGEAFPVGTIVLLAIAGCFYAAMLLSMRSSLSGDAVAGAALVVSGDFYSRHHAALPLEPILLPLLIGFYALWARLPTLQAPLPARLTSPVVWFAVAAISVTSLIVAANY